MMTKFTGRSRGLWPREGGSTGKAWIPGMAAKRDDSSRATSAAERSRSAQSSSPTKEMPWLTMGLPTTTK